MSRSRPSTSRALKLVALVAICSVGLIALPGAASAAGIGTCVVHDNQGAPLQDNTITLAAGTSTELTFDCQGSANVTNYNIDNTSSFGFFDDTTIGNTGTSDGGLAVDDAPNAGTEMIGDFRASSAPLGQYDDAFTFTADDGGADTFAPVTVTVHVNPAPPVCTINDLGDSNQTVVQGADAPLPVGFTCTDNGDGAITASANGHGDVGTSSVNLSGTTFLYHADAHVSGPETDAFVTAKTAHSSFSDPLFFDYMVTDAAPACSALGETLLGGQDAQLDINFEPRCSDADDTLTYTAEDGSNGAQGSHGYLSITGNQGDYREDSSDAAATAPLTETFQINVSDGNPAHDFTVPLTITINPDHAPVCTTVSGDDHQSVLHGNNSIAIRLVCADPDTGVRPADANFAVNLDFDSPSSQGNADLDTDNNVITYSSDYSGYGPDTIAVIATSNDLSTTLLVHVTVTDQAPACADVSLSMTNDGSDGADLACTDADGDNVNYAVDQAPLNGTVYQSGDSFFYYVPNDGFVGTDTFTVKADDDARQTPITVTAHVTTAPPIVVEPPVVTPVVAPVIVPVVTPPAIAPPVVIVTPPAPKLSSPVTVKDGKVSLELGCTNQTTSCKATVALTTLIGGKTVSLGTKAITIKPGKNGAIKVSLSGAAKKALQAFAGKTITVNVAVKTTNPKTGKNVTVTKALKVKVPRP